VTGFRSVLYGQQFHSANLTTHINTLHSALFALCFVKYSPIWKMFQIKTVQSNLGYTACRWREYTLSHGNAWHSAVRNIFHDVICSLVRARNLVSSRTEGAILKVWDSGVFTVLMVIILWTLVPCRLVSRWKRFGETYCVHLQAWRILPSNKMLRKNFRLKRSKRIKG
jgi:hypothetical protein